MNISELYIKEIEKSLIYGHAAVLIGSGFSMNAERVDGSKTHMPNWYGIADEFCEKLNVDEEGKRYADPLVLAQKIEELYGRPFLDDMLRELMSDNLYLPSKLHMDLLKLPWTDVFTTNYDTLLERACARIIDNKYHIVVDQKDILNSSGQTRIVKLHGSFPSNGPFIITEEDFRTYPDDHAPFVNTVQQSLLENTFILIGFSGDDPNFLKWIGWIHDNLGLRNSPKIYMICHNEESAIKTKMLAAKNIEVVALNDVKKYENSSYKVSLGEFLADMVRRVGKWKNTRLSWPNKPIRYGVNDGKKLLEVLKEIRSSYPGWITAPYKTHQSVANILKEVESFLAGKQDDKINELEISFEYCWLSQIIGRPLFARVINNIIKILEQNAEHSDENLFIEIQLYLLYSYRIHGMENEWEELYAALIRKKKEDSEISTVLSYENAMHYIYTFRWQELEEAVNQIDVDNSRGEWLLRKCSLLAMLGRYKEAEELLENCISYVRNLIFQARETKVNVRYISLESCLVSLYGHIKQASRIAQGKFLNGKEENKSDKEKEYSQPLKKDYEKDFIWQIENEKFVGVLSKEYMYIPSTRNRFLFDIGLTSTVMSTGEDSNVMNAYEYIGFREKTGHPFRIGSVTNKEGVLGAVLRSKRYSVAIPLVCSLLTADKKLVEEGFTRYEISKMSIEEIDILCERCNLLLRFSMDYYSSRKRTNYFETSLMEYPLYVIPDILSRLCSKCSNEKFDDLVDLAIYLYKYNDKDIVANVNKLIQRMIEFMPISAIHRNLDDFWDFELMESAMQNNFPDPFYNLWCRLSHGEKLDLKPMSEKQIRQCDELFKKFKDEQYHDTAILRVLCIYRIYKFSDEQENRLKEELWSKENLNEYGLPKLGRFYCVAADEFPHNEEEKILEKSKTFISNQLEKIIKEKSFYDYRDLLFMSEYIMEKVKIDENMLKKASKYTLLLCNKLENFIGLPFGDYDVKNVMECLDEFMGKIFLYSGLVDIDHAYYNEDIIDVIKILDKYDIPHALLTWCVTENDRDKEIMKSAFKGDSSFIRNANKAIYVLIQHGVSVSEDLKICLVNSIYTTISYQVNSFALGLEYLVRGEVLSEKQCEQVTDSLYKFDEMTNLVDTDTEENIAKKLAMRKVISMLAHTLYEYYIEHGKTVPMELLHWEKIAESPNEFADIRLCWE